MVTMVIQNYIKKILFILEGNNLLQQSTPICEV